MKNGDIVAAAYPALGATGREVLHRNAATGQNPAIRYERIALDASFEVSPQMMDAFSLYQKQLENLGLSGLEIRPVKFP